MTTTSLSLLERARDRDPLAWQRLAGLYAPLLTTWLQRYVQPSDADDLVQEVLLAVSKELPRFEHAGREGSFRAWLRTIMTFRLKNHWRTRRRHPSAAGDDDLLRQLQELEDPNSELSQLWDQQHDQHLLQQLLAQVANRFQPSTLEAFRRVVIEGQSPDFVAQDLGISLNSVAIAKCRVVRELRRESKGLLDT
jgi:RNA polymerase sigma-70 factor (ECF subfamily)